MRIVQISDLHLDLDDRKPHGVDTWDNFAWALDTARSVETQLIVLSGDLALLSGNAGVYEEIARHMERLGIDYLVIPGNHDDRELFADAFGRRYRRAPDAPRRIDFSVEFGGLAMYALDSSDTTLSDAQFAWLDSRLESHRDAVIRGEYSAKTLVWIHHPVVLGFHRYMDAHYALANADLCVNTLARYADRLDIHVFCGHYHIDHSTQTVGIHQHICPSLYVQIDPAIDDFRIMSTVPGIRVIDTEGTRIETVVVYREEETR